MYIAKPSICHGQSVHLSKAQSKQLNRSSNIHHHLLAQPFCFFSYQTLQCNSDGVTLDKTIFDQYLSTSWNNTRKLLQTMCQCLLTFTDNICYWKPSQEPFSLQHISPAYNNQKSCMWHSFCYVLSAASLVLPVLTTRWPWRLFQLCKHFQMQYNRKFSI